MKRAIAACVTLLAVLAAGCGSNAGSGAEDPAKLAPASTIAFASFELSPQGDRKADFDAAFGKLVGADPSTRIKRAFAAAIEESGSKLDYAADVEPWLGDTVAAAVTGIRRDGADYALLVASKDDGKAREAIDKDVAGQGAQTRDYKGTQYRLLDDGTANGVVDHYLVAGTEAGFKAVVDSGDGKSLADTEAWKSSVGDRGNGKVGLAWVDVKAALQAAGGQLPGAQRLAVPLLLGALQVHPFVATLDVGPDSVVVDVASPGTPAEEGGVAAASSPLIEDLPADSWFAMALPEVGQSLAKLLDAVKLNPLMAQQYSKFARQMRIKTGLDLERDVLAGLGDVGAFARGASERTIGGGVVVEAAEPAALRRTLATLPALIARGHDVKVRRRGPGFDVTSKGVPQPVLVRMSGGRAVAAYGRGAARAGLAPAATLGGTDLFRKAAAAVGNRPTVFATFEQIAALVRSSPHKHAGAAKVEARLAHLEYAAVGARREGKLDVLRAVLGLR